MNKHCIEYINNKGIVIRNKEGRKDFLRCLKWSKSNNSKITYSENRWRK